MKEIIHAINLSVKIWIHFGKDEKVVKDKMKLISLFSETESCRI